MAYAKIKKLGASFSTGKISPTHNFRTGTIPNNVDRERIKDNVILIDNLHGRTIEQFTNDEMQPHIDAYNKKQKRKDRRIKTDYVEWHLKDGLLTKNAKNKEDVKFAYEAVLCYGNNEDLWKEYFSKETAEERKKEMYDEAIKYYSEAVQEFQKKYKHLKVVYAVIHADEPNGSIHCHLCYQARAEYEKGLSCKVCIGRALEQDGIKRLDKRADAKEEGYQLTRLYKEFRHQVLNRKLEELGYEIMEETHGREHIPSNVYTEKMQEIDRREQELQKQEMFVEELKQAEEIERTPEYNSKTDTSQVKKTKVKETPFSKPIEVVQMPEDVFDRLRNGENAKKLNKETKEIAKRQNEAIAKAMESIRAGSDIELIKENNRLKKENDDKQLKINRLNQKLEKANIRISNLTYTIDLIKNFARNNFILQKLERYLKPFLNPEIEKEWEKE